MLAECKRELGNGKVEINGRKEGASSDNRALRCGLPAQKHVDSAHLLLWFLISL